MTVNRMKQLLMYNKWIIDRVEELTKQVEHTSHDPECKVNNLTVNYHKPIEFINDSLCVVLCMPVCSCCRFAQIVNPDQIKVTILFKRYFWVSCSQSIKRFRDLLQQGKKVFIHNTRIEEGPKR